MTPFNRLALALTLMLTPAGCDDEGGGDTDSGTTTARDSGTTTGTDSGTTMGTDSGTTTGTDGGGGGGGGTFTISLTGDFMTYHGGDNAHLKVFNAGGTDLGTRDFTISDSGATMVTIPSIIENGQNYTVRFWVDVNGNGACNPEPTDHQWELTNQAGTASGLTITFPHNTDLTTVCSFF